MSVTEVISVVLCIIVCDFNPGWLRVVVNCQGLVVSVTVKFGIFVVSKFVHVEFTPFTD